PSAERVCGAPAATGSSMRRLAMKHCWLALAALFVIGTTAPLTPVSAQSPNAAGDHGQNSQQRRDRKGKPPHAPFDVVEATIPQIQHAFRTRRLTSEQLVDTYLARIKAYDDAGPGVNAFLHVSRFARIEARWLDL